jgi:hypothetical protein
MAILAGLASIGALISWIMVLIKMFPAEGPLKGILGIICGLYAFVWGWMNAEKHNLRNVMIVWSIALVLSIIFNVIASNAS